VNRANCPSGHPHPLPDPSTPQDCGWVSRLTLKLMLLSRSASCESGTFVDPLNNCYPTEQPLGSLLFSALRPTVPPDVIVEQHDYAFLQADELLAGVRSVKSEGGATEPATRPLARCFRRGGPAQWKSALPC
jgi:hypothetical protein